MASLDLRAGDLVEVRSKEAILATLDRAARLDGMPVMPEMFRYCGQRFRVASRAERACDTIWTGEGRRVFDSVHLEGLRCDGSAHGGCQALCLIWWREAWLKRVSDEAGTALPPVGVGAPKCTEEDVARATQVKGYISATVYSCQATRLLDFTKGFRWWDPRAFVRLLQSRNESPRTVISVVAKAGLNMLRRGLGRAPQPHIRGQCKSTTPAGRIPGLEPGDWVVVKSQEEIEETLNRGQKNRGLLFDIEMLPYCGRRMRLLSKVDQIIDEKRGVMLKLPLDCWIIEGAVCNGLQSRNRLFCTRQIYPFWREIWLRRAEG